MLTPLRNLSLSSQGDLVYQLHLTNLKQHRLANHANSGLTSPMTASTYFTFSESFWSCGSTKYLVHAAQLAWRYSCEATVLLSIARVAVACSMAQAGERLGESQPLRFGFYKCECSHLTTTEVTWFHTNQPIRIAAPMPPQRLPVSLIVACSVNRVIGKQGKLPWNLPADWSFFSTATRRQVLVVGRRSFEEFDEPIPNRHTIVVSSTLKQQLQREVEVVGSRWSGIQVARTLEEALQLADSHPQYQDCTRVFIGGGERLYKEAMAAQVAESCYVTRVQQYIADGDTHFPKWAVQFPNLVYSAKTSGGGGTRFVRVCIGTTDPRVI